jgi:hypothetical protein
MERRAFLMGLGGGLASGASVGFTQPQTAPGRPLVSTYIANVPADSRHLPARGESILVSRDDAYAYDPYALAVKTRSGELLGYVPPIHSRIIEPMLAGGYEAHAWVEESHSIPRPKVRIALTLQPAGASHV